MLFDKQMEIPMQVDHPEVPRKVVVRWPTDEQWAKRGRMFRVESKPAAEGVVTETRNEAEVERWLFDQIAVSQEPELSDAEAVEVIERLESMRLLDAEREGNAYVIVLKVPTGETRHRVRVPAADERMQFNRSYATSKALGRGKNLLTVDIQAGGTLYDRVFQSVEGYAGEGTAAVPIIHKMAVVRLLLEMVESSTREQEGFF